MQVSSLKSMLAIASAWEDKAKEAIHAVERSLHSQQAQCPLDPAPAAGVPSIADIDTKDGVASGAIGAAAAPKDVLSYSRLRELLRECEALPVVPSGEGLLRRVVDSAHGWLMSFAAALPLHCDTASCRMAKEESVANTMDGGVEKKRLRRHGMCHHV